MGDHSPVRRASIVSGYFSPLHVGHLDLFHAARRRTGYLIVIVNNDAQQVQKKGRVIMRAADRLRVVQELKVVDEAMLSVDERRGIDRTFDHIRRVHPITTLEFCNGGDQTDVTLIPAEELASAARNDIEMVYGVGGVTKADSSTRIIAQLDDPHGGG